ncbi:helix-turn-helix domain-containing protein [Phaeobacter gallaeciensis]|uniref:helix-turn-helix domain-containing protein n=1 Tax=Phaeobacter gallaeciensis TaxID=60890 RepID=UPI0013149647
MRADEAFLTVEDFAAALHRTISSRTVRTMIHDGQINATKIGQRFYMTREELARFVSTCHANANRPDFSSAKTMALGSSSTEDSRSGQVLVTDFIRKQKKS